MSILVNTLVKQTVSHRAAPTRKRETSITSSVSEELKDGPKNRFCENEVPYSALMPGYKSGEQMDLVCFHKGNLEVLEFKQFDQELINDRFTAKNAVRVFEYDIEKLDYLYSESSEEYAIGLATMTAVAAVYNCDSGNSSYKQSLHDLIERLEGEGFVVEERQEKRYLFF